MNKGIVKKVTDKGFGFIKAEGRDKDLFFHFSQCKCNFNDLREGDEVMFDEIVSSDKGDSAIGINIL